MIVDVDRRMVFVHIPKTGGTAFTAGWAPRIFTGLVDLWLGKHLRACEILEAPHLFRGNVHEWLQYDRIAIVRNPWAMLWSNYNYSREWFAKMDQVHIDAWAEKLRSVAELTFPEFVQREALTRRGFWQHYCHDADGRDMVNVVFQQETLQADLDRWCKRRKIRTCRLPVVNRSENRKPYQDAYTPELRDAVGEKFAAWVERFGYSFA